jgi:predicted kinase
MITISVPVGAPGSGKTEFCKQLAARGITHLSLDHERGHCGLHPGDQTATPAAVESLRQRARAELAAARSISIDATHTKRDERAQWIDLAREFDAVPIAYTFHVPLYLAQARNAPRPRHLRVPPRWLGGAWWRAYLLSEQALLAEGFHEVRNGLAVVAA